MSDTVLSLGTLLVFAYLVSQYKKQSREEPATVLPLQEAVDPRRHRHDGTQPTSQRLGNLPEAIPWPEVRELPFF